MESPCDIDFLESAMPRTAWEIEETFGRATGSTDASRLAEAVSDLVARRLAELLHPLRDGQLALAEDVKWLLKAGPPQEAVARPPSRDSATNSDSSQKAPPPRTSSMRGSRRTSEISISGGPVPGSESIRTVRWVGREENDATMACAIAAQLRLSGQKEKTVAEEEDDDDSDDGLPGAVQRSSKRSSTHQFDTGAQDPLEKADLRLPLSSPGLGPLLPRTASAPLQVPARPNGGPSSASSSTSGRSGLIQAAAAANERRGLRGAAWRGIRAAMSATGRLWPGKKDGKGVPTTVVPVPPSTPEPSGITRPLRKASRFNTSPAAVSRVLSLAPSVKQRSKSWAWTTQRERISVVSADQLDMESMDALNTERIFRSVGIHDIIGQALATPGRRISQIPPPTPPSSRRVSKQESGPIAASGNDSDIDEESSSNRSKASRCHRTTSRSFASSGSNNSTIRRLGHMEGVRQQAEHLVMSSTSFFGTNLQPQRAFWLASALFGIWGVVPMDFFPRWHRNFMPAVAFAVVVQSVVFTVLEPGLLYGHLGTSVLSVGALFGLLAMRSVRHLIGPDSFPLALYAKEHGFLAKWESISAHRLVAVCVCWMLAVAMDVLRLVLAIRLELEGTLDRELIALGSFVLMSGLFSVVMYCLVHVLTGLEMMIDNFCIEFFLGLDYAVGVSSWNVLQAILRLAAGTIDTCFLIVQTAAAGAFVLNCCRLLDTSLSVTRGAEPGDLQMIGFQVLELLPSFFLALCAVAVFVKAAAVTEKCSRVPSLINSMCFEGEEINEDRQFVVQYITNSNAGFYVKGVRLTASMVIKLLYLCGAAVFGLATKLLSSSRGGS